MTGLAKVQVNIKGKKAPKPLIIEVQRFSFCMQAGFTG